MSSLKKSTLQTALAYSSPTSVLVPVLDHDKLMFERYGTALTTWCRRERRIIANLMFHLAQKGFRCAYVYDGEEFNKVTAPLQDVMANIKNTMEIAFNLDECVLRMRDEKDADKRFNAKCEEWGITLIFGNGNDGLDVISDWSFTQTERGQQFDAAMNEFDAEVWA